MAGSSPVLGDAIRLLLAGGFGTGITAAFNAWRTQRRSDRLDPTSVMAAAAEQVAKAASSTLEAQLGPLRAELVEVRKESTLLRAENELLRDDIRALRDVILNANLPVPLLKAVP